jgi:hypothetical protein
VLDELSVFLAYPAEPPEVGDTIEAAVAELRLRFRLKQFETWRDINAVGQFVGSEVIESIEKSDCFFADITVLNMNVCFEVGFAIGCKKPCGLIREQAISSGEEEARSLGIFDTLGWRQYASSSDLFHILADAHKLEPLKYPMPEANTKAPVYLLDARDKTDSVILVKSRIKKAGLFFRSFDPEETTRMSPYEAIRNVAESLGVIVTLLPKRYRDARNHNFRASFLAGLAEGMQKELLILQLGDDPVAIDYRDMVRICRRPEDATEAIGSFAPRVTEAFQEQEHVTLPPDPTILGRLRLGASAAENEFRELGAYYVPTDAYWRARRGEIRLVLGRKGSGKSALFAQVRDYHRANRRNAVIDVKPEGYKLLKFKGDVIDLFEEASFQHMVTAIWEYVLLLELTYKILEKDRVAHTRDSKLFQPYMRLSELYHQEGYSTEGDFSERLSTLLEEISSDAKAQFGTGKRLRLSSAQVTELIYKHNIHLLLDEVCAYLRIKDDVWVLVDNLDKGWPTVGVDSTDIVIIRTLLEATRKIERQLGRNGVECHTIVFLRNDVYEFLVEQTPDRGKENRVSLDWIDPDSLRELLRRRLVYNKLPKDASFSDLWLRVAVSHVRGEESSQFVIDRSLMRPRVLIDILNTCKGFAVNRNHSKIEEDDILSGVEIVSQDLVNEIGLEIRDVYPQVNDAVYVLVGAGEAITRDQLWSIFIDNDIGESAWGQLLDLFLWYGVLGFKKPDHSEIYIYNVNYDLKMCTERVIA